jgi:L-serine deaminase
MQCYYCCKHGHKATDCKLRERAKKLRSHQQKDSQKKTSKDEAAVNAAIATTAEDANYG